MKHRMIMLTVLLVGLFFHSMQLAANSNTNPRDNKDIVKVKVPIQVTSGSSDSVEMTFKIRRDLTSAVQLGDGRKPCVPPATVGTLTIPSEIMVKGKPLQVVCVGDSAFARCEGLKSVTFCASINTYGSVVFYECSVLKSIYFQGDIKTLPSDLIVECPKLEQVKFSGGLFLSAIPPRFLSGSKSLRYVYFPASLQEIGDEAFKDCNLLSQVSLPSKLKEIGDKAFYGCSTLQSFTMPDSLNSMGDSAVAKIPGLRFIDFRKSVLLKLDEIPRQSPALADVSDYTVVYLPIDVPCEGGVNVIQTDSAGVMTCAQFVVDDVEMTPEQCMSGEATYKLNKFFGGYTFRQLLGVDNYPIPSSEFTKRVFRVSFSYEDSVRAYRYVNTNKTVQLPDHEEMDIPYCTLAYYYNYAGKQKAFTNKVTVSQDLTVTVELKRVRCDANGDGFIDVQDVTMVINAILGNESDSYYEFNADVDNSGNVDVLDVTAIINKILSGDYRPLINDGLNILALGNSFMCDAFSYVPYILEESMPEVNVYFGMLNHGAASIRTHYNEHMVNKAPYELYYTFEDVGFWHTSATNVVTLDSVLESRNWDIILLQQLSNQSSNYTYYQPQLNSLIDSLLVKAPRAHIGWLLTPAFPEGYMVLGDEPSDSMFYGIADCSRRVLDETLVKFVIPGGTAIQNARHTLLDSLGTFGHLTVDGRHLQDGLPCLIEGLTVAQTLADFLGLEAPIDDVELPVTESWAIANGIPQFADPVVGMTESEVQLGKECVKAAIANPFEITLIGGDDGGGGGDPDGGGTPVGGDPE